MALKMLDKFKKGGEKANMSVGKPVYMTKRKEQDCTLEVTKVSLFESSNPKQKGHVKFLVVAKVVEGEANSDERAVSSPGEISYILTIQGRSEFADDKAYEESIMILAGLAGIDPHEIVQSLADTEEGKDSLYEELVADDGAALVGKRVRVVTTGDATANKGFYDLVWSAADAEAGKTKRKAS